METHLVFSMVGPDRTGLVDGLTEAIARQGGNLEDARMAVLGGEFAVAMLVTVMPERRAALERGMRDAAAGLGMLLLCKETDPRRPQQACVPFLVRVRGMDHEGIVHQIVHGLAAQGVSVVDLESRVTQGAFSGTDLFSMEMRILAPSAVSLGDLRARLEEAADRLNVDVELVPSAVVPSTAVDGKR